MILLVNPVCTVGSGQGSMGSSSSGYTVKQHLYWHLTIIIKNPHTKQLNQAMVSYPDLVLVYSKLPK